MNKNEFNFKTYYYIPYNWFIGILFIAGIYPSLIHGAYVFAGILLLLGALVVTSHYGISVNTLDKTYCDYVSILFIRNGNQVAYSRIDYVFIRHTLKSQTMNSMVTSRKFSDDFFDGYIKFDGQENLFLISSKDQKTVVQLLQMIATALEIEFKDNTGLSDD